LLLLSIAGNHQLGGRLARQDRSSGNALLGFGIAINLVLLGAFKYADFLVTMTNCALGTSMAAPGIPLPLAISFFTFLQIAFLVDCRRTALAPPGLTDYALFVSYFPHLVAGPLVHHRELIPQFR
jgi:D-alanyl-lipoteichoic acid acyltransferase DltB (MBOAT superfamily)